MELYRFVPIADVKLEDLEDDFIYTVIGNTGKVLLSGLDIRYYGKGFFREILLPYTQPEQKVVTDEQINLKAIYFADKINTKRGTISNLNATSWFEAGYKQAMRDQLSSKSDSVEFANWILMNNYRTYANKNIWFNFITNDFNEYTTEQLYELFKNQTK